MDDFSDPDISWEEHMAGQTQTRKLLQCIVENFQMQVVEEPMRRAVMLDHVLTKVWLRTLVGGSLGCSDHEMIEFGIVRDRSRANSKTYTLKLEEG